jgi:hypothetical protein
MHKTSKKILSLVIAVVLMLGVVSIGAYAFDASTQKLGFIITPDKDLTKLSEGDVVKFTVKFNVADFTQTFATYKLPFMFDSNVYDTTAGGNYTLYNDFANYYKSTSTTTIVTTATAVNNILNASSLSATEKAKYNAFINLLGAPDTDSGNTANAGYTMTHDSSASSTTLSVDEVSFNLTVKAGADLTTGNTNVLLPDSWSKTGLMYFKLANGTSTSFTKTADIDMEYANAMANNPAATGPVVAYEKAQLKMTLINGNTDVDDEFQFRVTSIISDADWDAYFANTAAGGSTDAITDLGIVATKGTWSETDAKAVVNGTANAAYEVATTDYVQKTSDTADAHFGAILMVKHSTTSSDVTYMGFVKYVDDSGDAQVIFYDAEKTAPLASRYDTYKANYISQFGA